jgi:hypothetical protein
MPQVFVLTLWNKPDYIDDAIASVKAQTRSCIHVVKRDEYNTQGLYPPAVYINSIVRQLPLDSYWGWLSDDDLLLPNYASDLADWLNTHPDCHAVYGTSEHIKYDKSTGFKQHVRWLPADVSGYPVFSAALSPYCRLDGGQFLVRRSILEKMPYPWYPEEQTGCSVCDGTFAAKLANLCGIHPLQPMKQVMVNRATPKSSHSMLAEGALRVGDWTKQRAVPAEQQQQAQKYTPEDVTVIVVGYNTLETTRVCLESLVTYYPNVRLVLVDNGSTDGSAQYMTLVAQVRHGIVLLNSSNVGHGPAMHQALQYCKTKYALMLDSDSRVLKGGWIERMLDIALRDDKVYAIGTMLQVNDAGDVVDAVDDGYAYIHPARMLIDVNKYKLLTPFNAHGAPCVMNMRDAMKSGLLLWHLVGTTVDGDECVKHYRGGTHSQLGMIPGWGGEGHLCKDAAPAAQMVANTTTEVLIYG